MSDAAYTTFAGLNQALESRWTIRKKCQAVELCLDANMDNYRGFFEQCFSQLLKQIFGYDGSSWLDQAAQNGEEANARALEDLLSPHGKLFKAMHSADADGLIRFMFPLERLPTHTQVLLALEGGRQELERWPQYRGRIFQDAQGRTQIHLNVLSYFLFWMAFYVLRGSQSQSLAAPTRTALYSHLNPSFGSVKKTLGLTRSQHPVEGHPYLRLLRLYLEEFLPRNASSRPTDRMTGLRGSGAAGSSHMLVGLPAAAAARPAAQEHASRGELLLSVFMEFWLADGDCPLPGAPGGGSGPNTPKRRSSRDGWKEYNDSWGGLLSAPSSSLRAVSFDPPSEDLVEALVVLSRYIVSVETPGSKDSSKDGPFSLAQAGTTAWLPLSPVQPVTSMQVPRVVGSAYLPPSLGAAARPPAQAFARSLYRLLRRSFAQWPEHRTVTPAVHLWCAYMAPWWPPNGSAAAASGTSQPQPAAGGPPQGLRRQLSHVGELVRRAPGESQPHGDASGGRFSKAQWQAHVLANLPFYSLLLPLFLEFTRSRVSFRCDESLEDLKRVLAIFAQAPELCELIAAVEEDYARFLQHPGRRPEGPYAELLPFLAEQAQDWEAAALATSTTGAPSSSALPELRMFSREASGAAQKAQEALTAATGAGRDSLLAEVRALAAAVLPMRAAEATTAQPAGTAAAAAQSLPPVRALQLGRREVLGYRGHPLRRPIASNEIAWLARVLVRASDAANAALGLDRPATEEEAAQGGPVQHAKEVLRRRGGINLRNPWGLCLAEVQTLIWIPVLLTALRMGWHTLAFLWRVISEPYEEEPHASHQSSYKIGHEHVSHTHEAAL
ncbi:hypothetical protein WJX75_000269 [Coccomyxa subellipsoidea]|uniref:Sphingomyelin phosphodiesterase 4 n=1 Tax=Coccomyxa subellipsoidea TaxID=248742 RepID=A0ABR2YZG4_9CHLO